MIIVETNHRSLRLLEEKWTCEIKRAGPFFPPCNYPIHSKITPVIAKAFSG
jgi:hypothetical protein